MIVTVIATGFDGGKNTVIAAKDNVEENPAEEDAGDDEDLSLGLLNFFKNKSDYED